jgi:ABC-type multidrug transport system fused ATPase/permease subunit
MDQGRILDDGTHGELLARCPLYRRLHDLGLRQTG